MLSVHFETLVRLNIINQSNTGLTKHLTIHLKQIRFLAASQRF